MKRPRIKLTGNAFAAKALYTSSNDEHGCDPGKNEETVGPVVVVEVVDTPEEAIAAANRTMYGLTSSIQSAHS